LLDKACYRIRQFVQGINVSISLDEQALVAEILSPPTLKLFDQMPLDAQRHSLNVLNTLRQHREPVEPNLAIAALLHDVGKVASEEVGITIGLWLRGSLVLLNAFFSKQMKIVAQEGCPPVIVQPPEPVEGETLASTNSANVGRERLRPPRNLLARWRYVLYVYFEHPAIGAEWAKQAGSSPLTCWLIAHHQAEAEDLRCVDDNWKKLLFALQQADGQN